MSKFKLGQVVMTRAINDAIAENIKFAKEITTALHKYKSCDWGNMCDEDKTMNNNAVLNNNDRILAAYNTSRGKIYIITESDRCYTAILFSSEY